MSEEKVSTAERIGFIILTATVGALVTTLVAHSRIEADLAQMWRESGGDPSAVTFQAQEAIIASGEATAAKLRTLPLTKIHSVK